MDCKKEIAKILPDVKRVCYRITDGDPLRDDLVQEVMLILLEKDETILGLIISEGKLFSYAYSIAKLNYFSKTSRFHYKYRLRQPIPFEHMGEFEDLPAEACEANELNEFAHKLVDTLYEYEEDREDDMVNVLRDYLFHGSLRKVCQDIGVSYTHLNVKFRKFKADIIDMLKEKGHVK